MLQHVSDTDHIFAVIIGGKGTKTAARGQGQHQMFISMFDMDSAYQYGKNKVSHDHVSHHQF